MHVSGHFSEFYGTERGHEDHDEDERVGALSSPLGKTQRLVDSCIAGDICAIAKLSRAETGDTLSDKDQPLVMEPWSMPEPLLPIALVAHAKADEDKLGQALQRLAAEDPTVRIEHQPETLQLILWCMGEAHADVLLDRLSQPLRRPGRPGRRPGAAARDDRGPGQGEGPPRQAERRARAVRRVRHRGRAAAAPAAGFEFVDKVVGGAVPRQFIPSVEKGVRAQLEQGPHGRLPGGRHPGDAVRRQGAQRRLERHGVPDRRCHRAA